mgnify:CR=1 FL=1
MEEAEKREVAFVKDLLLPQLQRQYLTTSEIIARLPGPHCRWPRKKYEPPKAELIWLSPRLVPILVKVFREERW